MLDWYFQRPSWIRYTIAIVVIAAGLTMGINGITHRSTEQMRRDHPDQTGLQDWHASRSFRGGIMFTTLGTILLVLAGKNESEEAGYNF